LASVGTIKGVVGNVMTAQLGVPFALATKVKPTAKLTKGTLVQIKEVVLRADKVEITLVLYGEAPGKEPFEIEVVGGDSKVVASGEAVVVIPGSAETPHQLPTLTATQGIPGDFNVKMPFPNAGAAKPTVKLAAACPIVTISKATPLGDQLSIDLRVKAAKSENTKFKLVAEAGTTKVYGEGAVTVTTKPGNLSGSVASQVVGFGGRPGVAAGTRSVVKKK
jgi:hypothetical protein